MRLPTDAEREWVACGAAGRVYPWSNAWDSRRCNGGDPGEVDGYADSAPVGSFPAGATPRGVHDLASDTWEWSANKLLRGGPWCLGVDSVRCDWKGARTRSGPTTSSGFGSWLRRDSTTHRVDGPAYVKGLENEEQSSGNRERGTEPPDLSVDSAPQDGQAEISAHERDSDNQAGQ